MEGLELLRHHIVELGEPAAEAFTDEQLIAEMRELHELESMLAAQRARRAAIIDDRKLWRSDGSKAFWAWLSRAADMSPSAAKALVRLSRGLRQAPLTRAAFEAGDIDRDRALELARRADSPRQQIADAFPEAEAQLLDAATSVTYEGLGHVLRYWESLTDQDSEEDQAEDDRRQRKRRRRTATNPRPRRPRVGRQAAGPWRSQRARRTAEPKSSLWM